MMSPPLAEIHQPAEQMLDGERFLDKTRDVEEWPARIDAVDADAVLDAARKWLVAKPAVTGHLLPLEAEAA